MDLQLISSIQSAPVAVWSESLFDRHSLRWLPLVEVTQTHLWIGLSKDGQWVIGCKGGAVTVEEDFNSPAWVTVLEKSRSELGAQLAGRAAELSLPISLQDLPIREIIVSGLRSDRAIWIEQAMAWLEMEEVDEEYRNALKVAARSRGAGQKNRQKAWRLLQGKA